MQKLLPCYHSSLVIIYTAKGKALVYLPEQNTIYGVLMSIPHDKPNFGSCFAHNVQSVSAGLAKVLYLSYNSPRCLTDPMNCRALYFVFVAVLNHIVINILCFCY